MQLIKFLQILLTVAIYLFALPDYTFAKSHHKKHKEKNRAIDALFSSPYSKLIKDKLWLHFDNMQVGSNPQEVTAVFQLSPQGTITYFFLKGKPQNPSAEKRVSDIFAKAQPFAPVPLGYPTNAFIEVNFRWPDNNSKGISGPYFEEEFPKVLR
jgi:hypothetical protein